MEPSKRSLNEYIADQLIQMSKLPDKNKYQKGAYVKAANAIRKFPQPITFGQMAKDSGLGVGESIKDKIDEILATGTLQVLEQRPQEEKDKVKIIDAFKEIYDVGDVTAEKWYNWGYRTLEQLAELFPQMTQAQQLGYRYYYEFQQRIPRAEIDFVNNYLHKIYDPLGINFVIAGSYRRGLPYSGDIDILMENNGNIGMTNVLQPLLQSGLVIGNLAIGDTVYRGIIKIGPQFPARRLDIRLVNTSVWPFALLYFTGSKDFNTAMRTRALAKGLSLSEYSLTDRDGNSYPAKTEKDIFDLLDMVYLEPPERTGNEPLKLNYAATNVQTVPIVQTMQNFVPVVLKEEHIETGNWYKVTPDFYIYISDKILSNLQTITKIAAFDLDDTLITTETGKFRKHENDIVIMPNRQLVLQKYIDNNYTIVIFTNQLAKSEKQKLLNYNRINNAIKLLNLPVMVFMSTAKDEYRKPNTGMWNKMRELLPNLKEAFFVGNAAGRPEDHSDSDLKFAKNAGIAFYLPEQFFSQ